MFGYSIEMCSFLELCGRTAKYTIDYTELLSTSYHIGLIISAGLLVVAALDTAELGDAL